MVTTSQIVAREQRRNNIQAIVLFITIVIAVPLSELLGIAPRVSIPVGCLLFIAAVILLRMITAKKRLLKDFTDVDDVYELRAMGLGRNSIDEMMKKYPVEFAPIIERFNTYEFKDDITEPPETIIWHRGGLAQSWKQLMILNENGIWYRNRFIDGSDITAPAIYTTSEGSSLSFKSEHITEFMDFDGQLDVTHVQLMHLVHVYQHRYKLHQTSQKVSL